MKPWKSPGIFEACALNSQLQWGHGDEAVEELAGGAVIFSPATLQWGHGDEAVEEPERAN